MFRIENLETVEGKPSKLRLVLTNGASYVLNLNTIAHFSIHQEKEISEKALLDILTYDFSRNLFEKAVSYILYSPRTESQVRRHMRMYCKKNNFELFDIEPLVESLKESQYINDEEFAEMFLKSRLRNKPRSKYLLQSELMAKGIKKELAMKMIEEVVPEELDVLKSLYLKKYGEETLLLEDKKKIGFLQRKGFSWDSISELIKYFEENDTRI